MIATNFSKRTCLTKIAIHISLRLEDNFFSYCIVITCNFLLLY